MSQEFVGSRSLPDIEAALADLTSDVTSAIPYAADGMAGRAA
jgi:hypothetical protein